MLWERDFIQEKSSMVIGQLMILFVILSFLFGSNLLILFIFIFGGFISFANYFYMNHVGKGLVLQNEKSITRLKIGDTDVWKFTFINRGLPILKGNVQFTFSDKLEPVEQSFNRVGSMIEVNVPFKVWHHEQIEISIPIKAMARGVSTIHHIEIKIPHIFGNGLVILQNKIPLEAKKLILPERKPVAINKKEYYFLNGNQNIDSSIFFDPMQPIGTREYQSGDSFQYIHWKASARTQTLQTKVFDNIGARKWLILFNIEGENVNLEITISRCAFLIEYALMHNIPYELAINVKTFGESLFYYLREGDGKQQRQKAFDLLAFLSVGSFTIPYQSMIKYINQNGMRYPYVIYLGQDTPAVRASLAPFSLHGSRIFSVIPSARQGVMELWR